MLDLLVLKKIKEGDIKTFEEVFRQYYAPLCFYSVSIIGRKDVAEEIVQELFYVLWKDRQEIQVLRSVKNYLYGAVRNRSLQYLEHCNIQERHRQTILQIGEYEQGLTPEQELEYKELENVINRTLNQLPERRRRIFRMHRMEGKKYKEIADNLALSVKTIEAEMTKAYQVLRQEIERYTHIL